MAAQNEFVAAMTNRSLRTIQTELEFLADNSVITPQQLSSILAQLPDHTPLRAARSQAVQSAQQLPVQPVSVPYSPPTTQFANTTLNEKTALQEAYNQPPPPAYQVPPVLSIATALYAYTPTDTGDLALQPRDRIQVLEHMNNDWWRGRNERTNLEGIFPRSYVNVVEEKPTIVAPQPTSYGNLPLEISQGTSTSGTEGKKSKFEEQGKKFGKKMGNAAIFGAGATIGSNIVNSIF
ncbi:hypothetical protein ASPZODRAFT_61993 [Penicilliopsis zonata CBS 506.65]|uniref:SH3 domain-containing protein n=1 Tax=Penicilliopsis zonata CBS 506.65 TaxID=1073090 RepID=A0A1L9SMX9_9EURO|nr:hypothetical protein ASPZODRAFT_61993 [Penicilliopsis zonata CBS 506.65]OJJ48622.1 hypothetical protein ASPZODRAFT_61993 [Penicilliopsis zonata CBS 506.65]